LRDKLSHPLVAPAEDAGVVALLIACALHHLSEITDESGATRIRPVRWDKRLMHVECDGKGASDTRQINCALAARRRAVNCAANSGRYDAFTTANVGQPVTYSR
jgi:hypothetical protein